MLKCVLCFGIFGLFRAWRGVQTERGCVVEEDRWSDDVRPVLFVEVSEADTSNRGESCSERCVSSTFRSYGALCVHEYRSSLGKPEFHPAFVVL